jgi:Mg-chelatase subunit ChlD
MAETLSIYIIDTSGSMCTEAHEVSEQINLGLAEQKEEDIHLKMVEFNTRVRPYYDGPVARVPRYVMRTGGMTALNDAVAQTIDDVGQNLASMKEADRPRLVTVTIVTDGMENSSQEYRGRQGRQQVAEKIRHQNQMYNWQFFYIGANQDAFEVAQELGIKVETVSNASQDKLGEGYGLTMKKVTNMTRAAKGGASMEVLEGMAVYSDEEKRSLNE